MFMSVLSPSLYPGNTLHNNNNMQRGELVGEVKSLRERREEFNERQGEHTARTHMDRSPLDVQLSPETQRIVSCVS